MAVTHSRPGPKFRLPVSQAVQEGKPSTFPFTGTVCQMHLSSPGRGGLPRPIILTMMLNLVVQTAMASFYVGFAPSRIINATYMWHLLV